MQGRTGKDNPHLPGAPQGKDSPHLPGAPQGKYYPHLPGAPQGKVRGAVLHRPPYTYCLSAKLF